jgi:lipopolysaccharide/colanic/teichoic acid biosynthesis glycosyltransferase
MLEFDPKEIPEAEFLFALSRRHAMPFSLVALVVRESSDTLHRPHDSTELDARALRSEQAIAPMLRSTDILVDCGEPGHYLVCCSGTDAKGAGELAQRLREDVDGITISTGCASFGTDGLTLEDLIHHVWSKVLQARDETDDEGRPPQSRSPRQVAHGHGHRRPLAPGWRRRLSERIKRLFDLVAVTVSAPIWLTPLSLVALAIKLSNPLAPILFVQTRTGRGGRRFPMYKFRTMVPNAEALKEKLRDQNDLQWPDFKMTKDPRITRIGQILRKTSLDELPQLFNVLRGDMSLVGPRPTSFEPSTYESWQTARLDVQPGLTGLWQIEGRAATTFDERTRIELKYIEHRSLALDLWILVATIPAVIRMRGGH